jgi:hypothetical protein
MHKSSVPEHLTSKNIHLFERKITDTFNNFYKREINHSDIRSMWAYYIKQNINFSLSVLQHRGNSD